MNTEGRLRREEDIRQLCLSVVEWSFLLLGVSAVACACLHFVHGDWLIHTEVLGLLFFLGIRYRSSILRKVALLTIAFWMLFLPFAAMNVVIEFPLDTLTVSHDGGPHTRPFEGMPITVRPFGLSLKHDRDRPARLKNLGRPSGTTIAWALGFFALFVFQFAVLTVPEIRRLFYSRRRSFAPTPLPTQSEISLRP